MRWVAVFLLSIAFLHSSSAAQEPKKEDDRPRLFRGGLIKRFEEMQERIKKDRESRRKDQEKERAGAVRERDERIRQLNERIEKELQRAGLDRNFDPFGVGRKKSDSSSTDKNPLSARKSSLAPRQDALAPNRPSTAFPDTPPAAGSNNSKVSLGVEVRPSGITSQGLMVDKVIRSGPAAAAGLRVDDRITSVGGSPIKKLDDLLQIMSAFEPGDRTEIEIVRKGKKEKLLVEFPGTNPAGNALAGNALAGKSPTQDSEELPLPQNANNRSNRPESRLSQSSGLPPILPLLQGPEQTNPAARNPQLGGARPETGNGVQGNKVQGNKVQAGIGVTAVAVDPILFERQQLSVRQGAYLEEIDKDSAAAKAGLKSGDVIIALDGRKVDSAVGMAELVQTYQPGDKAQILYYRQNRLKRTEIQMDAIPVARFQQPTKPIREADNLTNRSPSSSSRRNSILGELGQDFPRLKKVEEMIDRFGGNPRGEGRDKPGRLAAPGGAAENQPLESRRESKLENEVLSLRSRLKSQDRQIQELTEKLSLIEKLIAEKQSNQKKSDNRK